MLRDACRQFVAWRAEGVLLPCVAVNVSARQFRQRGFGAKVASIVRDTGIPPHCLELEINERLLIEANSGVAAMLDELRALGITIGLDDFGTGYSSLAYLKRFPIRTVKIDRTFVTDLNSEDGTGAIAAAIVAMAHALEKQVVAEGVETERQAAILTRLGCDHLQGHYYSRPLTAALLAEFVTKAMAGAARRPPKLAKVAARR